MSGKNGFEDLKAWQKSRELVRKVYQISGTGRFKGDQILRNQIRRACLSTMSNIGEGFERDGDKEFIQFLSQAKGSCGEVRTQLRIARDLGYLTEDTFLRLWERATRTGETIFSLIRYLKSSGFRGRKFSDKSSDGTVFRR